MSTGGWQVLSQLFEAAATTSETCNASYMSVAPLSSADTDEAKAAVFLGQRQLRQRLREALAVAWAAVEVTSVIVVNMFSKRFTERTGVCVGPTKLARVQPIRVWRTTCLHRDARDTQSIHIWMLFTKQTILFPCCSRNSVFWDQECLMPRPLSRLVPFCTCICSSCLQVLAVMTLKVDQAGHAAALLNRPLFLRLLPQRVCVCVCSW